MPQYRAALLAGAAALALFSTARADDDHGDRGHRGHRSSVQHVLLISVDGMHQVDLSRWVNNHPNGALATLSHRGVTFNNAYTTAPSDSFPGMIAQVTGGTPKSTGVFYDDSYDRTLFAPGSNCAGTPGTETAFAENLDYSLADYTGGGTLGQPLTQIDPAKLPLRLVDGVCTPVLPHQFIRVNTLFEVIRAAGGHTAWSDKHPGYEILNGPSGNGIEDLYTPEINADAPELVPYGGGDYTSGYTVIGQYDTLKVNAVLSEIDGWDSTHTTRNGYTPTIYGMNFQAVSIGQKLANSNDPADAGLVGGYTNADGTPGNGLAKELQFVDDSIGKMVAELQATHQYDNTLVIISAKHGQSPIDPAARRALPDAYSSVLANDGYGFNIADDASLIWLDPAKRTPALYRQALLDLKANAAALGIKSIIAREELAEIYRDPFHDSRTPDFYVVAQYGVIYTHGTKLAEHGGVADDDRHVAMLVSGPGLSGNQVDGRVYTTQIAPTILTSLGLSPFALKAVREEGTQPLPGLNGHEHD